MPSNTEGRELFRKLARGAWSPVYILYGEETFLLDEAIRAVRRAVLADEGDTDFNHQVLDGPEVGGEVVRQTLENLPLFGGRRLIHVRAADAMSNEQLEPLSDYLNRPAPDTCLLLSGASVDKRRRFFKDARKADAVTLIEFRSLYSNELDDWVMRRAKRKGIKQLSRESASLIAELSGPALAAMESALDKLTLHSGGEGRVTAEDIRHLLDDTRVRSIFELTAQLGSRDLPESLKTIGRMLDRGESAVGMVAMVARHFRIVWKLKRARARGLRGRELARAAGCPPPFVRDYERDARRFDEDRLGVVVRAIHDADRRLKSSGVDSAVVMSHLTMRVCL